MRKIAVHDKTVVLCMNKAEAKMLQRGLASGYFQQTVMYAKLCEKLVDALQEVEPNPAPAKER